ERRRPPRHDGGEGRGSRSLQGTVGEDSGGAGAAGGVGERGEADVLQLRYGGQQFTQFAALRPCPPGQFGEQFLRPGTAEHGLQPGGEQLGDDQPARHVQVFAHHLRTHPQPLGELDGVPGRAADQAEQVPERFPLGVPRARRTLVLGHQRAVQRGRELRRAPGSRRDERRADRVRLVRHGRAAVRARRAARGGGGARARPAAGRGAARGGGGRGGGGRGGARGGGGGGGGGARAPGGRRAAAPPPPAGRRESGVGPRERQ